MNLDQAIANTRTHLLSLRNAAGYWEGELSSSALSTATAVVALSLVDAERHEALVANGVQWLIANQNPDGGWGDTTMSKSNLSTTLLCWSALTLIAKERACRCPDEVSSSSVAALPLRAAFAKCEPWIHERVGSLEPDAICKAVIGRYGKDKTFSVPILMTCAIGGRLGDHDKAWRRVLALPFELAALPRTWFGAVGLPVVSYALPALIAIGHARFHHAPPAWWNPLRWLRASLWPRIRPMLKALQPSTGGYLEATPLTSFVTMALACAGEKDNPCVPDAVRFLAASQREDGSWPIDTNLATWATTLSVKALGDDMPSDACAAVKAWLLHQQYKTIHPFTNAAPGGWAWTNLPGGVPDADDTSGALIALWHLCQSGEERRDLLPVAEAGILWLVDLQNRDGGMPTFCRGWGTLPFDRSTPEITAHALWALSLWSDALSDRLKARVKKARELAEGYLNKTQRADGSWIPLWFGNEHAEDEENPVHGTAMVLLGLSSAEGPCYPASPRHVAAIDFLLAAQQESGGWGGAADIQPTIEETANAVSALASCNGNYCLIEEYELKIAQAVQRGSQWLVEHTKHGTNFPAAPIGLYFAKLWYHEKVYPVVWTLGALKVAATALKEHLTDTP
jgi:squalene-hopene/tetraprenyl-beta-curcumene cyclase